MPPFIYFVMADTNLLQGISNLSSAISPVANVGSQLLNIHFQKQENERNRTFADSQNTLAFQRQQQLLAEQRAYDSPKAQMQRLLEAGLNPNLIYGSNPQSPMQAMNAPNNATAASNQVAPQIDPLSFSQSLLNMANVRKLDTDVENSTLMTQGQLKRWAIENNLSITEAQQIQQNIKNLQTTMALDEQKILNLKAEERIALVDAFVAESSSQERINGLIAQYKISEQQAKDMAAINAATIAQMYGSTKLSHAQAKQIESLTPAQRRLVEMQAAYYQNAANKTLSEQQMIDLERELKEYYGDAEIATSIIKNIGSNPLTFGSNFFDKDFLSFKRQRKSK